MISVARDCGKEVFKRVEVLYRAVMMALNNLFKLYLQSGSDKNKKFGFIQCNKPIFLLTYSVVRD